LKAKCLKLNLPADRRIIAISDIHGNLDYLTNLLEQVEYTEDDILFILGDSCEKGPKNLETLRYIMNLTKTQTVFSVLGNCDTLFEDVFVENNPENDAELLNYLLWRQESLLNDMLRELGTHVTELSDMPTIKAQLRQSFAPEFKFLHSLPTIIETQKYIFVHAGLQSDDMDKQDNELCLSTDAFMEQGLKFAKFVVVGHWPVTLYNKFRPSANPIIDMQSKIISIDGGNILKNDGQLNALIIDNADSDKLGFSFYDFFPQALTVEAQGESALPTINIPWIDNQIKVLERQTEFSYCEHVSTGHKLRILNKYIFDRDGKTFCLDSTDYQLAVQENDVVSIIEKTNEGTLVKKDGITGWYHGNLKFVRYSS